MFYIAAQYRTVRGRKLEVGRPKKNIKAIFEEEEPKTFIILEL